MEKEYNERGLLTREATLIEGSQFSITNHSYDDLSREIRTYRDDNPDTEPVIYTYDIWGRKTSETDALGNTSTFTYNMLDHVLSEVKPHSDGTQGPETLVTRYDRDQAGRMTALYLSDDTTPVRQITYNTLGNPISVTSHPTSNPADDVGVSYEWDAGGRMVSEVDGASFTWTYAYNSQGLLSSSHDPAGNYTTLAYDKEGRTTDTTARDALGNTVSFIHPSYNPFGDMIVFFVK